MAFRLYGEDPQDVPTKARMPIRSAFFGRNEITLGCYDLLGEKGTITADEVIKDGQIRRALEKLELLSGQTIVE
jgi:hypothetical protein